MPTDIQLTASDGRSLAATLFEPEAPNGVVVQINSSSWTPRQYYRGFCEHLAGRGYTLLTYDYRGIGDSKGTAKDEQSVFVWGEQDQAAVTDFLLARFPDRRLVLLAHSLGGQIAGLSPRAGAFRALLLVGTAHGYWKRWPDALTRWRMAFRWYVTAPIWLALTDRIPASLFGGMEIEPRIAKEMCHFGKYPHWLVDADGNAVRPHNADIRAPLRHIVLSDDEVVPPGSDIDLDDFFPNAKRVRELRRPSDWGVEKVGHFGFFRRSMPKAAWDEAADWLASNSRG